MKKQLLTLTFIIFCLASYAQSTFTEATFTAMMSRLQTDPAFFKNEADPSLTITFGNGGTATQESMLKTAQNLAGLYKRKETNLKVSQIGSTAVATGNVEEQFFTKDKPNTPPRLYKGMFTYTFAQVKGKWLWVAAQHTDFRDTKEADEAAIKQVIEGQTQATYDRNLDKVLSSWANVPYLSMVMPSLNVNVNGAENLKKLLTDYIKGNPTPDKSMTTNDYRSIRIQGNAAYVLQNETITSPTGNITKYVCNRYLEKQNNEWKLVSATITPANNSSFSAKTLKEIFDEYKNDSKAFFNNRLSEDFRFTNQQGNYQPQKDFLGGTAQSIVSAELLQPVIFQSGDLAVTSGIHHNILTNKDGKQYTRDVAATYTWQRRNGKWMFVGSQQNNITAPAAEDEAAIKSAIEGETNAFKQREADKATGFWLNTPYTSHHYTAKGLGFVRGANVGTTITNYLKANPKIDNSPTNYHDYIIRINGNSAWATYISDGTSNGKKVVYNKGAYLEKTNGVWKMGSINSVEAK